MPSAVYAPPYSSVLGPALLSISASSLAKVVRKGETIYQNGAKCWSKESVYWRFCFKASKEVTVSCFISFIWGSHLSCISERIFVFSNCSRNYEWFLSLSLVCCLVNRGSTGGFLVLRYFSGIVSHPGVLQASQFVSVESSYLTHHRPYA